MGAGKKGISLSILSISCILNSGMMASAILADVAEAYPLAGEAAVQMVLTSISLFAVFFALLASVLVKRIAVKTLLLFALSAPVIGGMVGFFLGSSGMAFLFLASAMIACGQGMCSTLTAILIADYYSGDARAHMLGMQSATINGGGMIIIFLSGLFAGVSWNSAYLVMMLYLILIVITVKNLPKERPAPTEADVAGGEKGGFNFWAIYWYLLMFAYAVIVYIYMTNVSVFIRERALGDATTSGISNTIMMAFGGIAGLMLSFLKKRLKGALASISFLIMGLGLLAAYAFETLPAVMFTAAASGFGMAVIFSLTYYMASNLVKPAQVPVAMAVGTVCSCTGMFLSPLIIDPLSGLFAPGDVRTRFVVGAALCGVLTLAGAVAFMTRRKGEAQRLF